MVVVNIDAESPKFLNKNIQGCKHIYLNSNEMLIKVDFDIFLRRKSCPLVAVIMNGI